MPETGYFHLHLVSDATGETLITVARAGSNRALDDPDERARQVGLVSGDRLVVVRPVRGLQLVHR